MEADLFSRMVLLRNACGAEVEMGGREKMSKRRWERERELV